ncbi:hypothetical protein [Streptomyces sp. NBC_00299]|nr:hypothetical protein [Streptomyces sp. NBC_00299]
MTQNPQLSGVDLARVALRAAKGCGAEERRRPYSAAEAAPGPGGPARWA